MDFHDVPQRTWFALSGNLPPPGVSLLSFSHSFEAIYRRRHHVDAVTISQCLLYARQTVSKTVWGQ